MLYFYICNSTYGSYGDQLKQKLPNKIWKEIINNNIFQKWWYVIFEIRKESPRVHKEV